MGGGFLDMGINEELSQIVNASRCKTRSARHKIEGRRGELKVPCEQGLLTATTCPIYGFQISCVSCCEDEIAVQGQG